MRETLEQQVTARVQSIILAPTPTVDATLAQEYAKGEVAALQLVLRMPDVMLETVVADLKQLEEEMKND